MLRSSGTGVGRFLCYCLLLHGHYSPFTCPPAPPFCPQHTTVEKSEPQPRVSGQPVPASLYVHGAHLHPSLLFCSDVYLAHSFFPSLLASLNKLFSETFFETNYLFYGCTKQHEGSTRVELVPSAMEVCSLNHWAAREAPKAILKNFFFIMCCCFERFI